MADDPLAGLVETTVEEVVRHTALLGTVVTVIVDGVLYRVLEPFEEPKET